MQCNAAHPNATFIMSEHTHVQRRPCCHNYILLLVGDGLGQLDGGESVQSWTLFHLPEQDKLYDYGDDNDNDDDDDDDAGWPVSERYACNKNKTNYMTMMTMTMMQVGLSAKDMLAREPDLTLYHQLSQYTLQVIIL